MNHKEKLIDYLDERGKISISQAISLLDVSEIEASESLAELEAEGIARKVSGEGLTAVYEYIELT